MVKSHESFAYEKSRIHLAPCQRVVENIIQDIGIMQ